MKPQSNTSTNTFFRWLVNNPKRVIFTGLIFMLVMGSFIPNLTKDTRADAFLADDNPALVYREKVKLLFGLSDPMVIALVATDNIFTPEGLNAVTAVTDAVIKLANVDPEGVTSLATENNIVGTSDGMDVSPFFEGQLNQQSQADYVRDAIRNFPLYQGSLVAQDESATLVIVEILDQTKVEQTYELIRTTVAQLDLPKDIKLHVAGEGAIAGYLGGYIDSDAKRLNPMAGLVITIIVFIAFLRAGVTFMANVVIAASAIITMGAMAAFNVPFFVITNALPVILIGIAVADTIHIYSEYFERRALYAKESINDSIVAAMNEMWRPITLTTLTTAAGFLGLYFAAYMPPFKYFGLFTAIGVCAAWLYSLLFLPAAMALLKTPIHPRLAGKIKSQQHDVFARVMIKLGTFTQRNAKSVVVLAISIVVIGSFAASNLLVNENRIATFHPTEELYIADQAINQRFDGTYYLDVVVETPEIEGIFEPQVLNKIEALQRYAETLPNIQGSTSIVDYLKQMNRALNEGQASEYRLPQDAALVAQYFLLYSATGEPTDFEEEVDYDYQQANVRITLNKGGFQDIKDTVLGLNQYLSTEFNDDSVKGTLTGRVNLNYHWIKDLGASHFFGVAIALFLVWLVSSILFKSALAGFFALIPVATSILLVYSAMVVLSIPLGIGTSMFAAVAIGLGVDFAIHTIDRLRSLYKEQQNMLTSIQRFYPSTGRALFFNLLAIALGFGVLISSKVVPLNNFGSIVAISVTTSFLVSMTLLPAMIMLFKPRFITGTMQSTTSIKAKKSIKVTTTASVIVALALSGYLLTTNTASAETLPDGRWLAEQINAVEEGVQRSSKLSMNMVDRRGKERQRETLNFRKYYGQEKRTVLFYQSPKNVKDTGFLTYDYPDADKDDDQWLYLPALRKARRISASDRGDYFLGTDFTYEDIKKEGKFELSDYHFKTLKIGSFSGKEVLLLEAIPVDEETAKELGHSKVLAWVDTSNWIVLKSQSWDINHNELKTTVMSDIRKVDGIWTRHNIMVDNHKTGHHTEFSFSQVDYNTEVKDRVFTRQALTRGVPK
ncbi:MAG: putative RND superfamily exporter protein [Paraglaciecola sp.]|jgi:predicted RND superfamily exporter protein